jgi:hypothetical protein
MRKEESGAEQQRFFKCSGAESAAWILRQAIHAGKKQDRHFNLAGLSEQKPGIGGNPLKRGDSTSIF